MDTIKFDSGDAKVIAHRGLSGLERENTSASFLSAANRSYYGIETDVHITKDGKFVVIHDETTDRVTLGKYRINVETSDYVEIKNIVLPDLDGSFVRQDIRIPLLEEYIKICKKYDKISVIELKNHFELDDLKRMLQEIKEQDFVENAIFISFDLQNCINIRNQLPKSSVQWLLGNEKIEKSAVNIATDNMLDLDIYYKRLTPELVERLHSKGIKVGCWTCDKKSDAEKLVKYGVDFITSNVLEGLDNKC